MNSEVKKISRTKDRIIKLLTRYPEFRDNDERLIATFWHRQLLDAGKSAELITGFEFLEIYSKNEILTSADCIVRSRALIQQQTPELRGNKWNERHGMGEEVTKEIHKI